MKHRSLKAILISTLLLSTLLVGCGKKNEEPPETTEPVVEPPVVEIPVIEEDTSNIVDITSLPKEEWEDLTWEQVRDFTLAFLPSFRETYGIPEDEELDAEDWTRIKGLMFYQLFGQVYEQYIKVGEVYTDVDVVEEVEEEGGLGADWIYFEPTKEYLESLGPDEIAEYFQNFYPKVFGVTPTRNLGGYDEEGNPLEPIEEVPIQFRDLTDEELTEAMRIFMDAQF